MDDYCLTARELLSAHLDGEASAAEADRAARHLADCPDCAAWYERAARADRLLRVGPADDETDDLAERVMDQVALPRRNRLHGGLRATLALVALAQLTIGLGNLFGPLGGGPAMAGSAHMDHEEAAFNIAFGIALVMVAWNSRRASAHIPVLATFVLMLGAASVLDLADGSVTWSRLATHLPIVLGLLLSIALARDPQRDRPTGRRSTPLDSDTSTVDDLHDRAPGPNRRPSTGTPPAARRDAA